MLVSFYCIDNKASTQKLRLEGLDAHLKWVGSNMDVIKVAGPLKDNESIIGSFYILEADSMQKAKNILSTDPYYKANIWSSVEIREFNAYAGSWVGGENWPSLHS